MADEAAHLLALSATLGYMKRRLGAADYGDEFVRGYGAAYSDIAHIYAIVQWDWRRRDPEGYKAWAATQPDDFWESVKAMPDLGKHRIFPKEG